MKRKSAWMALGMVGILIGGGFLFLPSNLFAQAKTIVWNLPTTAAPTYYHTLDLKMLADKVKEKSNGRMEIRIHPASSLYPQQEQIPALVDGRVEIGMVGSGYMVDMFLECSVLELPFMTSSLEEHHEATKKLRSYFAERLAKHNIQLLAIGTWPTQQLYTTNKRVTKVEDWKGLKVRVYGTDTAEVTRALGGAPVNITFGEVYTALQRNVIDGAITSATNAEPMKFFEVAKYINYWFISGGTIEFLSVNKKALNALPQDLQQVVLNSVKESRGEEKEWEDAKAWDARAKQRCTELGMTMVDVPKAELDRARKLARPAWDAWLKRTGPEGKHAIELALKALGR